MSISGISSNSYNPYQTGANPLQQQFQQLGQALQSGNLSAAQSDFASLRAGFSQPSSTTGASSATSTSSTTSNPVNQASTSSPPIFSRATCRRRRRTIPPSSRRRRRPCGSRGPSPSIPTIWRQRRGLSAPEGQRDRPGRFLQHEQSCRRATVLCHAGATTTAICAGGTALTPDSLVSFDA